jgi:hypothetical protein
MIDFRVFNYLYSVEYIKRNILNLCDVNFTSDIIYAERSKRRYAAARWLGLGGSNSTGGRDVRLLSLRQAVHSSRGTLPSVVYLSSWNFDNEEALFP